MLAFFITIAKPLAAQRCVETHPLRLAATFWMLNLDGVINMDLSNLNVSALADAGITVQLRHPATGEKLFNDKKEPEPMTIVVAGSDSALFRGELKARIRQANLNKKRKDDVDIEEIERRGVELIAKCTLSWSGLQLDGKDLPFSYQAAVKLYGEHSWIKEQVDAAMADRSELFKA